MFLPNANTIILSYLVGRQTFEGRKQSLMSYPQGRVQILQEMQKLEAWPMTVKILTGGPIHGYFAQESGFILPVS